MQKIKVYIYGAGQYYNNLISYISMYTDIMEVRGIITTKKISYNRIDGYDCYLLSDIAYCDEYIIIAMKEWYDVYKILLDKGVAEEKILRSTIFNLPNFDLASYLKLKESNVSILSNFCLGGTIYNELGLKMLSPTINMYCAGKAYLKFLKHYKEYLSIDMIEENQSKHIDGTIGIEEFYPKGKVGDSIWILNHDNDAKNPINKWNKRRKRVNFNNIVALMTLQCDEDAYEFENLPIKTKLGIYYKDLNLPHIISYPEWLDGVDIRKYNGSFPLFVNYQMSNYREGVCAINWIKFLLGEEDYLRVK